MQCLEMEAIEEEGKDCLSLTACGTALQACPQSPWGVGDPIPSVHGKCTFAYSAKHSPQVSFTQHKSALPVPHSTTPVAPGPLPQSKQ